MLTYDWLTNLGRLSKSYWRLELRQRKISLRLNLKIYRLHRIFPYFWYNELIISMKWIKIFVYEMLCAIWHHLYNLKKVKNTHGGVLLLVKLQAKGCNITKSNICPWVFLTFFKLCKWYQIMQSITCVWYSL